MCRVDGSCFNVFPLLLNPLPKEKQLAPSVLPAGVTHYIYIYIYNKFRTISEYSNTNTHAYAHPHTQTDANFHNFLGFSLFPFHSASITHSFTIFFIHLILFSLSHLFIYSLSLIVSVPFSLSLYHPLLTLPSYVNLEILSHILYSLYAFYLSLHPLKSKPLLLLLNKRF